MKVCPVNVLKHGNKVVRNLGFAVLAGASLAACNPMPANVKEAFRDKNKTEYDMFVKDCRNKDYDGRTVQAKLDSLLYKDFFNTTDAANNLPLQGSFNGLAILNIGFYDIKEVDNKLEESLPKEQYEKIMEDSRSQDFVSFDYLPDPAKLQYKYDSVVYRRFFEKNGLLNEENIEKFEKVVQKTNPNVNSNMLVDRR